ncbi:MAG: hypothetical protein COA42_03780 [Alteromonadaceae bacterium]|nr:MAG: hypothetical protein COA42_03780 [Alteromonadaceae bacterium]
MSLKKDKQKVLGETFTDERVKGFLDVVHVGDTDPDFTALERAYRGMKADNFETFVKFFVEQGKNLNCTNAEGQSFVELISAHRLCGPYVAALKAAGAK